MTSRSHLQSLTNRGPEVLTLLREGVTNADIAERRSLRRGVSGAQR